MLEFKTEGMTCGHCISMVTKAVKSVDPKAKVSVDLDSQKIQVESQEDASDFAAAIEEAGYPILGDQAAG